MPAHTCDQTHTMTTRPSGKATAASGQHQRRMASSLYGVVTVHPRAQGGGGAGIGGRRHNFSPRQCNLARRRAYLPQADHLPVVVAAEHRCGSERLQFRAHRRGGAACAGIIARHQRKQQQQRGPATTARHPSPIALDTNVGEGTWLQEANATTRKLHTWYTYVHVPTIAIVQGVIQYCFRRKE
jgi:hypothetical protein